MLTPSPTVDKICPKGGHSLTSSFQGHTNVRVVYSDETGTGSEKEEPFTIVTAVMFNLDSQWIPVEQAIERLLKAYLPPAQLASFECHGNRLYYKMRRGGEGARKAEAILLGLHALAVKNKLQIFASGVDRPGLGVLKFDITPYSVAFGECLSAVDNYVHTLIPKEKVLWVSDKSREENNLKSALEWQRIRQTVDFGPVLKKLGHLSSDFDLGPPPGTSHIVDTIYFGHSHESRALQIADVFCTTIKLQMMKEYLKRNNSGIDFFPIIRPQVVTSLIPLFLGMGRA